MELHEYHRHDALGLAELVQRGEVTPTELLDAAERAAAERNPAINAITHDLGAFARAEVERGLPAGPFRGVPFLLKDQYQQLAGTVTTASCRPLASTVAEHDSTLTARYRAAGLVIFGKTNTPELALSPTTEPAMWGPTHNPWAHGHSAGGSSGGAAAAVAAGIVPAAHASDGGGSIRIPAAACGLVGLKPTRGRVPLGPDVFENWAGATCAHVVTRTVRDTAAFLDATAGPELGDSYVCHPHDGSFLAEVGRDPGRLHIALMTVPLREVPVDPEVVAATEAAAAQLVALGHDVVPASPAIDIDALMGAFGVITSSGVAALLDGVARRRGTPIEEEELEPATWLTYRRGQANLAAQYVDAIGTVQRATRAAARFHETHDLLLCPTLATPPPPHGTFRTPDDPMRGMIASGRFSPFAAVMNLTGEPSISLPLARSATGLPIGVMLTAALGAEGLLLRVAGQLERATPWSTAPAPAA